MLSPHRPFRLDFGDVRGLFCMELVLLRLTACRGFRVNLGAQHGHASREAVQRGRADVVNRAETEHLVGGGSDDDEVDDGDRVALDDLRPHPRGTALAPLMKCVC
jgi:hypothetical protein